MFLHSDSEFMGKTLRYDEVHYNFFFVYGTRMVINWSIVSIQTRSWNFLHKFNNSEDIITKMCTEFIPFKWNVMKWWEMLGLYCNSVSDNLHSKFWNTQCFLDTNAGVLQQFSWEVIIVRGYYHNLHTGKILLKISLQYLNCY